MGKIVEHILREIVVHYFILLPFYGIGRTFMLITSGTGVGCLGGVLGIIPFIGAGFFVYWGLDFVGNLATTPGGMVQGQCTTTSPFTGNPVTYSCTHFTLPQTNYVALVIGVAILIVLTINIERIGYEIQGHFADGVKAKNPQFPELPEFKE